MRTVLAGLLVLLIPLAAHADRAVEYTVAGESFQGYHVGASGTSKGLVLIVHDWDGLTDYERKRAEMLAEMGHDAFALDLYGKGNRPQEMSGMRAESGRLYEDRERMRTLLLGGLQAAHQQSPGRTVVIGYCFGGAAALELARSGQGTDVAGYVTFHGGLATPEGQSYPDDTPPLLIAHGGADNAVSQADVTDLWSRLESKGITYEIEVYSGAPHAFTVFGSSRYREHADEKSWAALQDFMETNLAQG